MIDVTLVLWVAGALALVVLNGVFVAAEFAIVRVRRTRLEELAGLGREEAKHAIELVDRVGEYLTTTQVGITAASLGVGWLGEDAIAHLLRRTLPTGSSAAAIVHGAATSIAFCFVTMLLTVLGEIVPKNLAIANADRYVMALARPLRTFHRAVQPVSRLFTALATFIQRRLGHRSVVAEPLSEQELKLVLNDSHEDGVLTEGEAKIILRAFEFADKRAEEIMVQAELVAYLSLSRSFEENLKIARRSMHARMPLCEAGLDSVRGVVNLKDVWLLGHEASNDAFVRSCRPPTTIPSDLSQEEILRRLQADRTQMGIVRDAADRRTIGVVTLEDVLDALIGDVREAKLSPPVD
jgi:CBS domain containing-hemolysin-like protein